MCVDCDLMHARQDGDCTMDFIAEYCLRLHPTCAFCGMESASVYVWKVGTTCLDCRLSGRVAQVCRLIGEREPETREALDELVRCGAWTEASTWVM